MTVLHSGNWDLSHQAPDSHLVPLMLEDTIHNNSHSCQLRGAELTRQMPSTQMSRWPGSQGVPSTTAFLCL